MRCKDNSKKERIIQITKDQDNTLKETGRLQYFFHSPLSKLPVRDVTKKKKKEPHIEIGAENYWKECYQPSIKSAIRKNEKYLFLFTTCRNKKLKKKNGKKFIVGYIKRKCHGKYSNGRNFVKGNVFLYPFKHAMPLSKLGYSEGTRVKLVDEKDTQKILNHFKNKENILNGCIKEIIRLDEENETKDKTCLVISKGYECKFKNECLRWKK
jgi:hypothetical protein